MIKTARGNNDNPTNRGTKYDTSTENEYERNYRQNKFLNFFFKVEGYIVTNMSDFRSKRHCVPD